LELHVVPDLILDPVQEYDKAIVIPVYNEVSSVRKVVEAIVKITDSKIPLYLINDGSNDGTEKVFHQWVDEGYDKRNNCVIINQKENKGYGFALLTGFTAALARKGIKSVLTMDCDEQHEPKDIPVFFSKPNRIDFLSGSRYLEDIQKGITPPADRVKINRKISQKLEKIGLSETGSILSITDSFCGMKRYSIDYLRDLTTWLNQKDPENICSRGYAFPLLVWRHYFRWVKDQNKTFQESFSELAIPKIYITDDRSFGESLDQPMKRYRFYLSCLNNY